MDIYSFLSSKPHNPHYLNRYITFISQCQQKNIGRKGYSEKHHICPKAKDMFPEYKSFTENPWNLAKLTARQHFIAHIMLWKAFPNSSQEDALWAMKNKNKSRMNSSLYESLRLDIQDKNIKRSRNLTKEGKHPWQGDKNPSVIKMKKGTHLFQSDHHPAKLASKNKTHPWFGPETNAKYAKENARKRVESGVASEAARKSNKKRIEAGTHHWQDRDFRERMIKEGKIHTFNGEVACVDANGVRRQIPKDLYYSQEGPKENWEFVQFNTKEGFRRRGIDESTRSKNNAEKGFVPVVDKSGQTSRITKEEYYNSSNLKEEDRPFVHTSSKEGKRRKMRLV